MIETMAREVPVPEEDYRRFKRRLFDDAVSDWTGVYEAWWTANAEFPDLAVSERLLIAEQAVRELVKDGHLDLYRGTWEGRPGDRVPREEYDATLREWATWTIPQEDQPSATTVVWMGGDEPKSTEAWQSVLDSL
jgi:hypothetical protein